MFSILRSIHYFQQSALNLVSSLRALTSPTHGIKLSGNGRSALVATFRRRTRSFLVLLLHSSCFFRWYFTLVYILTLSTSARLSTRWRLEILYCLVWNSLSSETYLFSGFLSESVDKRCHVWHRIWGRRWTWASYLFMNHHGWTHLSCSIFTTRVCHQMNGFKAKTFINR